MSGKEYVLKEGSLRRAICATCAIPGAFPPIPYGERLLVDGGWANPIPVDLMRQQGADLVIAVHTSDSMKKRKRDESWFGSAIKGRRNGARTAGVPVSKEGRCLDST